MSKFFFTVTLNKESDRRYSSFYHNNGTNTPITNSSPAVRNLPKSDLVLKML